MNQLVCPCRPYTTHHPTPVHSSTRTSELSWSYFYYRWLLLIPQWFFHLENTQKAAKNIKKIHCGPAMPNDGGNAFAPFIKGYWVPCSDCEPFNVPLCSGCIRVETTNWQSKILLFQLGQRHHPIWFVCLIF